MGRSLSTPALDAGVSSIASAAGFAAGDYVYQQRTGNGPVPSGALATGAFPYNNISSSTSPMSTTATADLNYVELQGGNTGGQCAARLNNGNIVIVYARNATATYLNTAYFRIVDAAGATVVAETAVSAANVGGRYGVSVCVLPNNNFVVVWTQQNASTTWQMSYRVYQQDGTAVTAAITSTIATFGAGSTGVGALLKVKPRSDNSFIMMGYTDATFGVIFMAANAAGFITSFNGTGSYSRTLRGDYGQYVDFAIRSDDTIHIFFNPSGATLEFNVLSSTGSLTSSGIINNLNYVNGISCCLMPSGNVNVFVYGRDTPSTYGILAYSWNGTAATYIGKVVSFSTINTPEYSILACTPQGASGNFTLFWAHAETGGALTYQTFNSSGVSVSGSVPRTIPSISYPLGNMNNPAIFDVGSETRVYMSARLISGADANTSNWLYGARSLFYFAYNSTSYAATKLSPINYNYGNQGALPLGAYAKSDSTPVDAAFTISSTGTYLASVPAGTNLINKTIVSASASNAVSVIQLQNGNFAFAWQTGTNVFIRTYTPAGVEVGNVTVATNASSNSFCCAMAPFSNGTFAIIYGQTGGGTILYKIYNSSLTQLFAGTVSSTADPENIQFTPKIAAYGDGSQVAIAYRLNTASNYHRISELTSANVLTTINTGTLYTDARNFQLIPMRGNAFSFVFMENGGATTNYANMTFVKTGPTTWLTSGPGTLGSTSDTITDYIYNSSIPFPGNQPFALNNSNSSTNFVFNFFEPLMNATSSTTYFNQIQIAGPSLAFRTGLQYSHAIGCTGNGAIVWACLFNSTAGTVQYVNVRPLVNYNTTSYLYGTPYDSGYRVSANNNYGSISICPLVEGSCVIAFLDNDRLPSFFVPMVQSSLISRTITAGTDISTSRLNLTPENGFVLRGVALTTASAGGSGLVQTKGVASVSASYPAGTPYTAFDFRCSTATGVRGSITGRTVTMEG